MYTEHFSLNILPFENVPDPKFFFDEGEHARIHNRIKDSLNAGRGLVVVTGPIGSGKTTISQKIFSEFSDDLKLIWMAEPPASSMDLFMFIAQELGIKSEVTERTFVLRDIRDALLKARSGGTKCLIIIDESHLMSDDVIDGIRMLNNLEEGPSKLVHVLLLGQDELLKTINRPELEPFKQRIANLEVLGRLSPEKIREYILHRIHVAGGNPSIFSDTGMEALSLAFGKDGVPRVVNLLCDRSLNAAFENGKSAVDVDDVYNAAEGMGMSKEVFHYKMGLKNMNKKPAMEISEKTDVPQRTKDDYIQRPLDSIIKEKEKKKGLRSPVVMLLIAVAVLGLSVMFFCSRSGSDNAFSCILDLIGL